MAGRTLVAFIFCVLLSSSLSSEFAQIKVLEDLLGFEINWNCVKSTMSMWNFNKMMAEFRNCANTISPVIEKAEQYAEILCNDPNYEICLIVAEKNQLPCLSNAERQYIQYLAASFTAQKNYVCRDNAKAMKDLQKTSRKAIACLGLQATKAEFLKCGETHLIGIELEKLENRLTEKNCRKVEKSIHCVADVSKRCDAPEVAKFHLDSYAEGAKATPCKIVIDNPSSSNASHTHSMLYVTAVLIVCALI